MIQANELRIGNLVLNEWGGVQEVDEITFDGITPRTEYGAGEIVDDYHLSFEAIYPIPITEEWLLKFGFEKTSRIEYGILYSHPESEYFFDVKGKCFIVEATYADSCDHYLGECNNVHELQNLFFTLFRNELTFKLPAAAPAPESSPSEPQQ